MSVALGRVKLDEHGVHSKPFLGFIGRGWSLSLDAIVSWAVVEQVMTSRAHPEGQVLARIIELHFDGGVEHVRWGRGAEAFDRFVAELDHRIPGKRTASLLEKLRSNDDIPR